MTTKNVILTGLLWGFCQVVWADLNTDLQNAAEEGDITTIQTLIKQGADIETRYGNTSLFVTEHLIGLYEKLNKLGL